MYLNRATTYYVAQYDLQLYNYYLRSELPYSMVNKDEYNNFNKEKVG